MLVFEANRFSYKINGHNRKHIRIPVSPRFTPDPLDLEESATRYTILDITRLLRDKYLSFVDISSLIQQTEHP